MNPAFKKWMRVSAKMSFMNERTNGAYEIVATRPMFDLMPGSYEFVLSKQAQDFIADNDLGNFSLHFDEEQDALMVIAPNDDARTLFRLSF